MKALELAGKRFGSLTVLERGLNSKRAHSQWRVRCDCGQERLYEGSRLTSGNSTSCGCKKAELIRRSQWKEMEIGTRYGNLTITHVIRQAGQKTMCVAKCDCGGERFCVLSSLKTGQTKRCESCPEKRPHSARRRVYRWYTEKAKRKNLSWNLSEEQFFELTSQDCYYCGARPSAKVLNHSRRGDPTFYNGVDRFDNSRGYEVDNCVPCCITCNKAKLQQTYEEFISWVERVAVRHGKSRLKRA